MSAPETPAASFEDQLQELEAIVLLLERGDAPLEEALLAFEKGVALSRQCQSLLDVAEQRVQVLLAGPQGEFQATGDGGER